MVKYISILAAFLLHGSSSAQELSARAWVDSSHYLIGDWIGVHIELKHPAGTRFQSLLGDTIGGFHIIERSPLEKVTESETRTLVVVAAYDSGKAILPPLPFLYTGPGDSASKSISTNPLFLVVNAVPVDTAQEIRDVKPPLAISLTLAEILLLAGMILAIAAAAFLLYRYWKKRQAQPAAARPVAIAKRPAHVIALEGLALVKEKHLWQQGLIKEYYSEVTDVVREYFENRFGFMALEQTTDEIMSAVHRDPRTHSIIDHTEQILRLADLVKFAKYQPGVADHEHLLASAYDIVERTRPVAQPQPEKERVEANAGA